MYSSQQLESMQAVALRFRGEVTSPDLVSALSDLSKCIGQLRLLVDVVVERTDGMPAGPQRCTLCHQPVRSAFGGHAKFVIGEGWQHIRCAA